MQAGGAELYVGWTMAYTLNWAAAAPNGSYTLADGAQTVGVTVATANAINGQTASIRTFGTDTGLGVSSLTEAVTTTITFARPISNLNFSALDVDAKVRGWDDKLTIIAKNAAGQQVPITFGALNGVHSIQNGNILNADGNTSTGIEGVGAKDSVVVDIVGPITSITFIMDNGESFASSGVFGISNLRFDSPPLDGQVEGTAGNDLIDSTYLLDPEGDKIDANDGTGFAGTTGDADYVVAGAGNDTVIANLGNDIIYGEAGDDSLTGGIGSDQIFGGADQDKIFGGADNDTLYGDAGNDSMFGGTGNDSLYGGDGDDTLSGDAGNNRLEGGAGTDTFQIARDNGTNTILGGESVGDLDALIFDAQSSGGVRVVYTGSEAGSYAFTAGGSAGTFAEIEKLTGSAGNDSFDATLATLGVSILASGGSDTLIGGRGADTLSGGDDADRFLVGTGDRVDGGEGGTDNDTLVATSVATIAFDPLNRENGTITFVDNSTMTFTNIEKLVLNGGNPDGVVQGTAAGELIGAGYVDRDGDIIDARDSILPTPGTDADEIYAGDGNDTVYGLEANDSIYGGEGDDQIYGGNGDDYIEADAGNDAIYGGDGNDFIRGKTGDDTLYGGAGNDQVFGGFDNDLNYGGAGNDTIFGFGGTDTIFGGADADTAYGGDGASLIYGDDGDDNLNGDEGRDTLYGGAGNDTLVGNADADTIYGGVGDYVDGSETGDDNDTLYVTDVASVRFDTDNPENGTVTFRAGGTLAFYGIEKLFVDGVLTSARDYIVQGTAGDDRIDLAYTGDPQGDRIDAADARNGSDDDVVQAGTGNDTVISGAGADQVFGGDGNDSIDAGTGNDTVAAGTGNDSVQAGEGADSIDGGAGDDSVSGQAGNDTILGADGDDSIAGDEGDDRLFGGAGRDTLIGDKGNDLLDGGADSDQIFDSAGDDTAYGGAGDDVAFLGDGGDLVFGGSGTDKLYGEAGDDTLTGDDGADYLDGGDDRDTFFVDAGDTIDGGEGGDDRDTLDLTRYGKDFVNVIYDSNRENGTVQFLDINGVVINSMTFSNIENVIPCFSPGTRILTEQGEEKVEDLQVGARVLTRDHGYQEIRWIGRRDLNLAELIAEPRFSPIRIARGAMGDELPERDMLVSPQHRMLIVGPRAEMMFGEHEVLVAATHMVGSAGVERIFPREISYIHIMFDQHEIVQSDGCWSESFQPGAQTIGGLEAGPRAELLALFPELAGGGAYPAARMTLKAHEARVMLAGR